MKKLPCRRQLSGGLLCLAALATLPASAADSAPATPPAEMRLGSTVPGRIKRAVASGIEVPASALIRADGSPAVWVVDPQALTVSARAIEVQAQDPTRVQVRSGLKAGDLVVTAGVHALRPGQKVRLLEAAGS